MKRLFLFIGILIFFANALFGQDKTLLASSETIIDHYFRSYSTEPEYKVTSLNEEMINSIRKGGVWGSPRFDKFMRQVTLFESVRFKSIKQHSLQIFAGIEAQMKKDHLYKSYLKLENKDSAGSYFYIKYSGDKIKEFAFITINADFGTFSVSSFNGEDINIDTLRSFIPDK